MLCGHPAGGGPEAPPSREVVQRVDYLIAASAEFVLKEEPVTFAYNHQNSAAAEAPGVLHHELGHPLIPQLVVRHELATETAQRNRWEDIIV
jgi:hypothetical protein